MQYALPTHVTADGIIVSADNIVLGYKCMACSTAHTFSDDMELEDMAAAVMAWKETHQNC